MKKLLILLLFIPLVSLAQRLSNEEITRSMNQWVFAEGGNPIDGFQRTALRINNEQNEGQTLFILSVKSTASSIRIENSTLGDGDNRDDITVELKTAGSFEKLDDILMYFDNEKKYYKVNFRAGENWLLWWNATESIDTGFISRFNFIEKLKSKNKVFFRFKFLNGEQINTSFTLNGSAGALNKVIDLSNLKNDDYRMDFISGLLKYQDFIASESVQRRLKLEGLSSLDFSSALMAYLSNELGKYSLAMIIKYEWIASSGIVVYDLNDKMVITTGFQDVLNFSIEKYMDQAFRKLNYEDYNGAIADFSKAIDLAPDVSAGYRERGIAKEYLDDLTGACTDWKKAAELGDRDALVWVIEQCN